jgi:predicted ATPase
VAELYRMKGELIMKNGDPAPVSQPGDGKGHAGSPKRAQAQSCFEQALAIAKEQHTKSWELKASMNMYRLDPHRRGLHTQLADIYHSFSEGYDTADLKQARAILEQASSH